MISFPNAKINLGLYVTGKREDGFHNIESIFYPVPFCDVLEIVESDHFSFECTGMNVTSNPEDNLCVKAYRLLQTIFDLPPVNMFLLKNIPAGAGLGGGSSDASFTLKVLNDLFKLNLSVGILSNYAAALGSDCPFFITNYPAYVFSRGELMEAVDVDLTGSYIVIVCPGIHIPTVDAYKNIKSFSTLKIPMPHQVLRDKQFWKETLKNDFEDYAFDRYPVIKEIKEQMYASGAFYASMSGSGSAVYGLFKNEPEISFEGYKVWKGELGKDE
jgi:4-diphosphocytidyl-2-C-methyl-D-erythritol kinase